MEKYLANDFNVGVNDSLYRLYKDKEYYTKAMGLLDKMETNGTNNYTVKKERIELEMLKDAYNKYHGSKGKPYIRWEYGYNNVMYANLEFQ